LEKFGSSQSENPSGEEHVDEGEMQSSAHWMWKYITERAAFPSTADVFLFF